MLLILPLNPVPVTNVSSKVPSELRRARSTTVLDPYSEKTPPTMIFPSDWRARACTCSKAVDGSLKPPGGTAKVVSMLPSAFNRAINGVELPLYEIKAPPAIILSSGWTRSTRGLVLKLVPELNDESTVPSGLRRVKIGMDWPLYVVKTPVTMTLPSD